MAALIMTLLMGCETAVTDPPQKPKPIATAPSTAPKPKPIAPTEATDRLRSFYQSEASSLETRGLLRIDGGNVETPFTSEDIATSFAEVAFQNGFGLLRKWQEPVRVSIQFGPNVTAAQKQKDRAEFERYTRRLARLTDHPITMVTGKDNANFLVIITGTDNQNLASKAAQEFAPSLGRNAIGLIRNLPRSIQCLVYAYGEGQAHNRAVVVIRDELPGRLRQACIHEELAQGLGLGTDSPKAYPSIFNDDDEFALLTTHDEALLKLLYDPALQAGIRLDDARLIIRRILELPPISG